jgi:uncharacterized membrane protein
VKQVMPLVLLRRMLSLFMLAIGLTHFLWGEMYLPAMPPFLPLRSHLPLVWLSGAIEVILGIALELRQTRRLAAWGLVALYVAVFPANLHVAFSGVPFMGQPAGSWVMWARLPFQVLFIAWARRFTQRC